MYRHLTEKKLVTLKAFCHFHLIFSQENVNLACTTAALKRKETNQPLGTIKKDELSKRAEQNVTTRPKNPLENLLDHSNSHNVACGRGKERGKRTKKMGQTFVINFVACGLFCFVLFYLVFFGGLVMCVYTQHTESSFVYVYSE